MGNVSRIQGNGVGVIKLGWCCLVLTLPFIGRRSAFAAVLASASRVMVAACPSFPKDRLGFECYRGCVSGNWWTRPRRYRSHRGWCAEGGFGPGNSRLCNRSVGGIGRGGSAGGRQSSLRMAGGVQAMRLALLAPGQGFCEMRRRFFHHLNGWPPPQQPAGFRTCPTIHLRSIQHIITLRLQMLPGQQRLQLVHQSPCLWACFASRY